MITTRKTCWLYAAMAALSLAATGISAHELYESSGSPAHIPEPGEKFSVYLEKNRAHITAALRKTHYPDGTSLAFQDRVLDGVTTRYTMEEAVKLRMPFEIAGNCEGKGAGMGILLIHGLMDSPYLLRNIGEDLHNRFPCSLVRAILLPGHGTAPADSLTMTHEQWSSVLAYGIAGLQAEPDIDDITLVGFSTGTPLALSYMADSDNNRDKISHLAFLSPAVKARSRFAFLTLPLKWFGKKWLTKSREMDAARYESFTVNAGAQFYLLTRGMTGNRFPAMEIPIFMAVSGDDATINSQAAGKFYCEKAKGQGSRMLWYRSTFDSSAPTRTNCAGMDVITIPQRTDVLSYSHVSISTPEEDEHYGIKGRYRNCKEYEDSDSKYEACINNDARSVYAENNLPKDEYENKYLRRGTFNPLYRPMLNELIAFLDTAEC